MESDEGGIAMRGLQEGGSRQEQGRNSSDAGKPPNDWEMHRRERNCRAQRGFRQRHKKKIADLNDEVKNCREIVQTKGSLGFSKPGHALLPLFVRQHRGADLGQSNA